MLKWITERVENKDVAIKTPIGYLPKADSIDLSGLNIDKATMEKLLTIDPSKWLKQAELAEEYFKQFGTALPKGIKDEVTELKKRLQEAARR